MGNVKILLLTLFCIGSELLMAHGIIYGSLVKFICGLIAGLGGAILFFKWMPVRSQSEMSQ